MFKFFSFLISIGFVGFFICHDKASGRTTAPEKNDIYALHKFYRKPNSISYLLPPVDSVSEITINLVGDLMCHLPQTNNAKLPNGEYDFNPSFEYIKPNLEDADFTIGNLETTFAGTVQPYAGYPAFNSP